MPDTERRGRFDYDRANLNIYHCVECRAAGIHHEIQDRPCETPPDWVWGCAPAHERICTGCGASDGPWVKASFVEGY